MSICHWCDRCQRPYSDLDEDARAMTLQVPDLDRNGIKRGVIGVERHQCGNCTRAEQQAVEARRRELVAAADPTEESPT